MYAADSMVYSLCWTRCIHYRVGNSLIGFLSDLLGFFAKKLVNNEQISDSQKNEQFAHSLIFSERPEPIAHGRIFW